MNCTLKIAFAAAAVVVAGSACGQAAVVSQSPVTSPSAVVSAAAVAPSKVVSQSPVASPSPEPTPGQHVATLVVAGTDVTSSPLTLTVELPPDWQGDGSVANKGTSLPPAGMAFVVTLVDNTFADPCAHREWSPKVGPTVVDLATALGKIPNTTASRPVKTTIAGHDATYIEIAIPTSLPCDPSDFYLIEVGGGYWWVQGLGETARVWIVEVGDRRVAFLAHSYPGSGANARAEFEKILNSIVFAGAS